MLLSLRVLENVTSVNDWEYATEARFTEGDTLYIYFQLVDLNKDKLLKPAGRRYMPAVGATAQVIIQNIDATKTLTKTATQPYATDGSIWRIQLTAADLLKGSHSMLVAVTESSVVTRGFASNAIWSSPQSGMKV